MELAVKSFVVLFFLGNNACSLVITDLPKIKTIILFSTYYITHVPYLNKYKSIPS